MTSDATRYEGEVVDAEATRHEGASDPEATRHEGGGGQAATRHEGVPLAPGGAVGWYDLPAGLDARYEVLRVLSRSGGQADILLCRDRTTGEEVAIKLYRGRPQIDLSTYEKLQALDAAHVSPILDLRVDEDGTWEVQEYFRHGSLHDLLAVRGGGPHPPEWVRLVVTELTEALQEIHSQHITHRDLKPGNVFVRTLEPLDLVLGDFGFARDITMSSEYMSLVGVFHYTAPEVQRGLVSPAADWWALGTITFELLTGHSLFIDDTGKRQSDSGAVKRSLDRSEYSIAEVTDPRWHLLLRGLLNRSYKHRWRHDQVAAWLAGESPDVVEEAEPTPTTATPQPPLTMPWGTYDEPAAAVASMAAHWDDACGYLNGKGSTHLRLWLEQSPTGDVASRVLRAVHDQDLSAEDALVSLQLLIVPDQPVQFQGRPVGGGGLAEVARLAASGDTGAQEWIVALRRHQVLGAVANHSENGPRLAAIDLALRQRWVRLDELLRTADGNPQLRPLVPTLRGALEGVVLASCLDDKRAAAHAKAARTVASTLTDDDPQVLRAWGEAAAQGSLPEAIALEHFGPTAVQARKDRQQAQLVATRERELAAKTRQAQERRANYRRQLRARLRAAARRAGARLLLTAVLVGILTVSVLSTSLTNDWRALAWAYATPLAICVALAFVVDAVLPSSPPRVAYALGAAALGWLAIGTFPDFNADFAPGTATDPWVWLVSLSWWFTGGYVAGHILGLLTRRMPARGRSQDKWLLTEGPLYGAIMVAGVGAVARNLDRAGLTIYPGETAYEASRAVTFPIFHSLPVQPMWYLTLAVAGVAVLTLSMNVTLGGGARGLARWLRIVLALLALLVVIYQLPLALLLIWVTMAVAAVVVVASFLVSVVDS